MIVAATTPGARRARATGARGLARLALLLGAASLTGCWGTPPANEYYYVLAAPTLSGSQRTQRKGPTLAVAPLQVAPGYESQRLVYRGSEHELRYYGYRRWAADPAELATRALIRHLRASGRFARVDDEAHLPQASALLGGTIEAIEELDRGDQTYAHLAATLTLQAPDGSLLLRHEFDEVRRCAARDPRRVVALLSQILAEQATRLAPRALHALAR
ncbi:MAG: membrane integrity-associated transporter subunit PqiC [Proteobacteria bacterium]|nr:membrane integrity-associated transporter subunit PqiC [Pseudomonadota bacterium]